MKFRSKNNIADIIRESKPIVIKSSLISDELTGTMTERKFMHDAAKILRSAEAGEYNIITIDIDNFKFINEIYGYDMGSRIIVLFSNILRSVFPEDALISRFFADNFVILHRNSGEDFNMQSATIYEEKISDTTARILGKEYRLTTSSGIYKIEDLSLPLSYMIDCANIARLNGKHDYGISKKEFTSDLEQTIRRKNDIVRTMEKAISDREFQVYYQPKVSLTTGKLVGAEALIRWICADGQRRFPDEFIPLFESNGFIRRVDFFVLESVCQFLQRNADVPCVAVNFSGISMLDEDLVERISAVTQRYNVAPSRLEIEITESAVVNNFEPMVKQTAKLQSLGFTISMDDFGAGVSSLNRLKDLSIDVLKIDRAFLGETELNERGVCIIEHIISMSKMLGISTVAEGVETPEQANLLKSLGCDMVQGYYYSRALPEADYLDFTANYEIK